MKKKAPTIPREIFRLLDQQKLQTIISEYKCFPDKRPELEYQFGILFDFFFNEYIKSPAYSNYSSRRLEIRDKVIGDLIKNVDNDYIKKLKITIKIPLLYYSDKVRQSIRNKFQSIKNERDTMEFNNKVKKYYGIVLSKYPQIMIIGTPHEISKICKCSKSKLQQTDHQCPKFLLTKKLLYFSSSIDIDLVKKTYSKFRIYGSPDLFQVSIKEIPKLSLEEFFHTKVGHYL